MPKTRVAEGAARTGTVPMDRAVRRATCGLAQSESLESCHAKQEEGLSTGPDQGSEVTAAVGGSQTIRFERFTLQASTSGGGT